ncbi:SOS response-associated peptidase family protein [Piscinibacter gummiphilus]|uniref:Abasic site processing protein n=2 Tax=Piscinibacter gummiphilus TaxID=946333 RepID=A0ABZ0CZ88_9BURK|nr:SOS response-associated peptidase family protein [Piscinibacter gummiphilus]WOB10223.1 SOS response-associated peptidase family protein [Piscinibacter gummiphilus]
MLTFFGVEIPANLHERDVFPLGEAPFIRLQVEGQEGGRPAMVAEQGAFGLRPGPWAEVKYGRRTYNARSETVHALTSFKRAWANGQRCIVPAEAIYEPRYFGAAGKPGKSERWRIAQEGDVPMGIAGIYSRWRGDDGREVFTFAMLTVNADGHPVMQLFHEPGEEKRMVVVLAPEDYMRWLTCTVDEAPQFFKLWMGPLKIEAAPLARGVKTAPPPPPQDELF